MAEPALRDAAVGTLVVGKHLAYQSKEVFTIKEPQRAQLPAPNLSTSYVFATDVYKRQYFHNAQAKSALPRQPPKVRAIASSPRV